MRRVLVSWVALVSILQAGIAAERLMTLSAPSRFLKTPRTVRIHLPASYEETANRRYPVLYVHDGQNVFSTAGTNACFGWGTWELDKTVDKLCRAAKMQEIILVGVDNSSSRYAEYCGRHHPAGTNGATEFEAYTSFLIEELKPRIDREFRTQPGATSTGVMGSSMGGICSMVLAWERPEVFGLAASLSGAFQVEGTNFLNRVLVLYGGGPKPTRLYLDSGVVDFTGADDGRRLTESVVEQLRRIGWGEAVTQVVDAKPLSVAELERSGLRRDKWSEAQTSQHNEFYWRLRVWRALTFLFPPISAQPAR